MLTIAIVACLIYVSCSLRPPIRRAAHYSLKVSAGKEDDLGGDTSSRALFALTETFGKILSSRTKEEQVEALVGDQTRPQSMTFDAVAAAIKGEYEALFWVTGNMDTSLWADDCFFADPFSSFGGQPGSTARFETNAKNLGKLVLNPKARITSFEANEEDGVVSIGWTFSSKLSLPWRPVLAAAGVTSHYLNKDTLLIERYLETWKSKPWDVVKRLFVPTKRDDE